MSECTVLLADPHAIVRVGVRSILESRGRFRVVAEARDGEEAVTFAAQSAPHLVVLGLELPVVNGLDATRRILETRPDTRVVVLSADEDAESVDAALRAGARGYVSKRSSLADIVATLEAVSDGGVCVCPRATSGEPHRPRAPRRAGSPGLALTARERAILQLVAEGHSNRSIAARLDRSVKTIEAGRHRITRKLGLFAIADLTKYAVRQGLTSLDT